MAPFRLVIRSTRPMIGRDRLIAARTAGGRRQVGVGQNVAQRHGVSRTAESELRATVEPKPAEPEDEDAKRHRRHVGGRRRLDAAVGAELALPRADDESTGKGRPAAGRMHDGGAGEILEAHLVEPALAPRPGADHGIDEGGQQRDVDKERPELHPFGQCAGDDRGGRRHEHHLEEPIGHGGVAALHDGLGGGFVAIEQGDLISPSSSMAVRTNPTQLPTSTYMRL